MAAYHHHGVRHINVISRGQGRRQSRGRTKYHHSTVTFMVVHGAAAIHVRGLAKMVGRIFGDGRKWREITSPLPHHDVWHPHQPLIFSHHHQP
jgi:hypothetical protein